MELSRAGAVQRTGAQAALSWEVTAGDRASLRQVSMWIPASWGVEGLVQPENCLHPQSALESAEEVAFLQP